MKRITKIVTTLIVSLLAICSLCACSFNREYHFSAISKEDLHVGLICIHDENSTYDKNFIDSFIATMNELYGDSEEAQLHYEIKTGIEESEACYSAANELAKTCNIIFADSFGHEDYMMKAASENPTVRFCHATGTKAHTSSLGNYSNAFADIYEGRYLAGFAAGLKLNLMQNVTGDTKIGYVGAFPYAEVISGYTSFYLGVKAAYTKGNVTMDVKYTGSWYNELLEKEAANTLIQNGCVLISQHADSKGAPEACKEANVPNVTYNISTESFCGNSFVAYSRINWQPYYEYAIKCTMEGVRIDADYSGNLVSGSVEYGISSNTAIWGGVINYALIKTQIAAEEVRVRAGLVDIFDTNTFKRQVKDSNGLVSYTDDYSTYLADVNDFGDYIPESKVIVNGIFKESTYRSAPYFDIIIEGINVLSED